jgi:transcription elongation GreA/GreB family factor
LSPFIESRREMTLLEFATNGQLEALEEAWLAVVEAPGPVEEYVAVLEGLAEDGWTDRAAPLALLLAEPLLAADRFEDALAVIRPVSGYSPEDEAVRKHALAAVRGLHAEELWRETFLEASGLAGDEVPAGEALARYEHMCDHEPGRVVLNAAGWGLGVIEERGPTGRLMVRFRDRSLRPFDPHQFSERLRLLDVDDFHALKLTDPEGLLRMIKEAPGDVVRSVAKSRGGSVSSTDLRNELLDGLLTKPKWTTFWKSAREAVTHDPLIALEGPPTRPIVVLRERPVTLAEEAETALRQTAHAEEAARVVASYLSKGVEGEEAAALLDRLAEHILPDASRRGAEAAAGTVAILLVLEENGRSPEPAAAAFLREACGDSPLASLVAVVGAARDAVLKNGIVRLVPDAWPEGAVLLLRDAYLRLPREVHDTMCATAFEVGGGEALADLMTEMLRLPSRHAVPLIALTKAWNTGRLDGVRGAPAAGDILHALIPILAGLARGTGERLKLFKTWHQLVSGRKNSLLDKLVAGASEELARAVLASIDMHRDLPEDIASWIRGGFQERFPDLIRERDIPFWEHAVIYCTYDGIDRRKEELRVLVEEKIPENAAAIGRAASFGDLSENAEWQAAIEERGILSQRAEELRGEVDLARPLENAPIPEGVVAPGCLVKLREESGTFKEILLLGPWDRGDERIVSYRSPLAAGILGAPVGDEVVVDLPDGRKVWTVESVEVAV